MDIDGHLCTLQLLLPSVCVYPKVYEMYLHAYGTLHLMQVGRVLIALSDDNPESTIHR